VKRWHNFEPGQSYRREEVVEILRRHISSGRVEDVEEKQRYAAELEAVPDAVIKFASTKDRWGSSPMNPNAWRTPSNEPIKGVSRSR
jgi:hypothetical protein